MNYNVIVKYNTGGSIDKEVTEEEVVDILKDIYSNDEEGIFIEELHLIALIPKESK